MKRLPAWIGWPGTGPAPGHDWIPGPKLRFVILLLTYAFLALSLTVDYAYSVTFFLLAIVGTYIGLRRGFLNGLTSAEKLVMLAFITYPLVGIASYLFGIHSSVGFRMLGRVLRLALFIPVYLSIRWSMPKKGWLAASLIIGAALAVGLAAVEWSSTSQAMKIAGGHLPRGAASVHITFGDIGLLFGLLGSVLIPRTRRHYLGALAVVLGLGTGLTVAVLSVARGSWVAFPLVAIFAIVLGRNWGLSRHEIVSALVVTALAGAVALTTQPVLRAHFTRAWDNLGAAIASLSWKQSQDICPNGKAFLSKYVMGIRQPLSQRDGSISLVRADNVPTAWSRVCKADTAILLRAGANGAKSYAFILPRVGFIQQAQVYAALAKGNGNLWMWHPFNSTRINTDSFKYVEAASLDRDPGVPAVWSVAPGRSLVFVPLQYPTMIGGYSLLLVNGSVAERLHMWRLAWRLFLQHPAVGWGLGAYQGLAVAASLKGNNDAIIARGFEHPHSGYLNNLYGGGLLLFAAFIWLLSAPAFCGRNLSALLLSGMMAIFALTESMFVHSFVITCYLVLTTVVVSQRYVAQDEVGQFAEGFLSRDAI